MKTKYCSIEAVWPKNLAGICMQESELSEVTLTHHQVRDTIPTSLMYYVVNNYVFHPRNLRHPNTLATQ